MMNIVNKLVMLGSHPQYGGEYRMECRFHATDAGRSLSKRPKQRNDCVVRALALAVDCPYDEAYDFCAKILDRKCGQGTYSKKLLKVEFRGYRFSWKAFQAVKDMQRMTPVTFAISHPTGRFILKLAKHVVACVDGVVMDITDDQGSMGLQNRCVYGAYEAKKEV